MFDTETHKEAEVRREENNCVQHQPQNRNHETARLAVTLAMSPSAEMKTTPTNSFLNSTTAECCTKTAGDEPTKTSVNGISNKTSIKPSSLTIPGTMKQQNVNVYVSGNQISLINADGTGKSLNLKDLPNIKVVIKDLKNVFPNLKQNSTVVFLKKQLNPTNVATDAAAPHSDSELTARLADHAYARATKVPATVISNDRCISDNFNVIDSSEDSRVSTVECLTDDPMDLGYNDMLNGLTLEDIEKTHEIEEQIIYETLPVDQSPPPLISKRRTRPNGKKQHELEIMGSNSVAPKRGQGRNKGSKKQKKVEPQIVRGNIHSLMKELPPVGTYRKAFSGMILRETSVIIHEEKQYLSSQSSNIHSRNSSGFDHAYSFVSAEYKDNSKKRKSGVSIELDDIQIISEPPMRRKPQPYKGKYGGNGNELEFLINNQTPVHSHKEKKQKSSSLVQFEASTFFTDDEKVEFYTGINSIEKLWLLFRFVEDRIDTTTSSSDSVNRLPLFEQFCLTLIRLRLNLQPKDMVYRFGMKLPELVDYITRFFSIMFKFLVPTYIHWSSREEVSSTLPNCFKLSGLDDCVCIVELLEVSLSSDFVIEDDSSKKLTYLVGFTPTGFVSFVSIGFPGTCKKENIWLKSGIMDQLEHGDWILTERGKSVYKAEAIKKTAKPFIEIFGLQLIQMDDDETFSKRIVIQRHCKRVIESLKKRFAIFQAEITGLSSFSSLAASWNGMATVDQMVKICCALHNS